MRIHVACNIPIFVLLDEAHLICAFRVSVRDRAWQRGGAEIAICNPGRLIDVVKSGPQTCFANLWLSQKLPNHSLHRSSCDESTRIGWKAATCSAVHTLSRSQMMWLACCTFCPCFFFHLASLCSWRGAGWSRSHVPHGIWIPGLLDFWGCFRAWWLRSQLPSLSH